MTLYEFKLLDDERQYELIFNEGNFIDFKLEGKHRYALYAVFKFFAEIEYSVPDNVISAKRIFVTGKLLDKYSSLD